MKRGRAKPPLLERWSALLAAQLATLGLAACSVDTRDIDFYPDDEFRPRAGASGLPAAGGAGPPSSGGAGGTFGNAGAGNDDACAGREGAARCWTNGELELCKGGTWTLAEKCESESLCSAPRKTCLDCAPGTFRCTRDTLEQCNLEGTAYELVKTCEEGQCQAEDHAGFCKVCEPGEAVCEPSVRDFDPASGSEGQRLSRASLRRCNDEGSGTELIDTCKFSEPICDADEQRCLVCKKDEVVCDGSVLSRCSEDGMRLEELMDCGNPALCDAQRGACTATECSRLRDAGDTEALVECHGEDGTELSFCGPNGEWDVLALCDSRAACEAGTGPRLCRDPNESFCVPGSTSCQDGILLRCADFAEPGSYAPSGGKWYEYATCAEGCGLIGGIAQCGAASGGGLYADGLVCSPGEAAYLECSGGDCAEASCDRGTVCASTQLGCRACIPNTLRCEGNVLVRCDDAGSGEEVVQDCGTDYCDRFRGKCLPARPGEPYCSGAALNRVGADGVVQMLEVCASDELCSPEAGCLEPACVVGSKVCDERDGRQVLSCSDGTALKSTPTRCPSADRCEDALGCVTAFRAAAGEAHTCVLLLPENGEANALGLVKCWGANESGQLGNGAAILGDEAEARPVVFRERDENTFTASARFLSSGLCAGKNFTCADAMIKQGASGQAKRETGVVCWGMNDQGQLGLGTAQGPAAMIPPNAVTLPVTRGIDAAPRDGTLDPFVGIGQVTCGADFACALDGDGGAWCWGANDAGQLGIGQATAAPSPSAQKVVFSKITTAPVFRSILAGAHHACAIDDAESVWCWGSGVRAPNGAEAARGVPQRLELTASNYALGRDFTIVQSADRGALFSFGQNFFGQLGTGTSVSSPTPVAAAALEGDAVSLVFSGPTAAHACAFSSGSLQCWGANSLGQLGDGTTEDRYLPVVVIDSTQIDLFDGADAGAVALGKSHTCAVDASGSLWCWGGNERKQLGESVADDFTTTPTEALTRMLR